MPLRSLTPRQIASWSDAVFRAALEDRPLPAGHPLSWGPLHPAPEDVAAADPPVFGVHARSAALGDGA